ncbi:MAG TPA: glycoside hydrolase family 3 N-terminal domain-containing protein, partial [Cyclobacteriaceae bacterium]|nr:glycoside hydrolase family 3 N-terminal domain-containing protein [Cyclobacteriaceae bacterium]
MQRKVLSIILFSLWFTASYGQTKRSHWVDSVFNTLNQESKIGQLFMVPASSNASQEEIEELTDQVKEFRLGGIYITGGSPIRHARLVNKLQINSNVPLLIGMQAEWGPAQTLDSLAGFQKPMMASAWKADSLVTVWGQEIARQLKMLGVNINFAPNADDEVSFRDYSRYFSNDEHRVGAKAVIFSKALQAEGILAVAKHLPRKLPATGSVMDSTMILHLDQIDTAGFLPFEQLIQNNVDGILTNNLHFSLQNEKGILPASMSKVFVPEILRRKMKFNGLVFSDVINFSNPKNNSGDDELLAFEAGNDVLLNSGHLRAAIKKITKRIKKDKFLLQQLDASVKKILTAKFNAGLHQFKPVDTDNLLLRLNSPAIKQIKRRLSEAAVTVVKNEDNFLPIQTLDNISFLCLSIGSRAENEFSHYLKKYAPFETASLFGAKDTVGINAQGKIIVIGISQFAADLELQLTPWINRISRKEKVIIVHFGNPASLDNYPYSRATLAAYSDQDLMRQLIPQVIFGALSAGGVLPMNLEKMQNGKSISTATTDRFVYTLPEEAGVDSRALEKIKSIMKEAIDA